MKIWIDDIRPAPEGYIWCKSVNEAKEYIEFYEQETLRRVLFHPVVEEFDEWSVSLIDIDHDAGDYAQYGGDYIKILDWLEETNRNYPIHIHSMNPVGIENMRRIIQRNNWKEV